jgi:hypothetical protein
MVPDLAATLMLSIFAPEQDSQSLPIQPDLATRSSIWAALTTLVPTAESNTTGEEPLSE